MQDSIQLSEKLYYIGLFIILLVSSILGLYLAQIKSFDSFVAHDLVPINNVKGFPIKQEDYATFVKPDEIPGFIYSLIP
ncbi:hypothetical protein HRbin05_00129 [archaeon HR05]|nr:hypothetical protein HRbin05_00129 [archaeon HR05]